MRRAHSGETFLRVLKKKGMQSDSQSELIGGFNQFAYKKQKKNLVRVFGVLPRSPKRESSIEGQSDCEPKTNYFWPNPLLLIEKHSSPF